MKDAADSKVEVAVWDWPVRVVHWAIVVLVATSVTTGLIGGDAVMDWHMRSGEALLALVVFRIVWGFAGSRNARFVTFVRGPGAAISYFRSLVRPPRQVHATHNPIGGWFVVALLATLLIQCVLGLFTHDEALIEGPLVKLIGENLSDTLSWLHRRGWWVVVGLASVHIAAILWYFAVLDDDLVYPMVSGAKTLPRDIAQSAAAAASTPRALILLALCAFAVWWMVTRL